MDEQPLESKPKFRMIYILLPASLLMLGGFVIGGAWFYQYSYVNKVYPGVRVGHYDIGGLSQRETKNFIENINNRYAKEGIDIWVSGSSSLHAKLNTVASGESAVEMLRLDSDALSETVLKIGRGGSFWNSIYYPLKLRFKPVDIRAPLVSNDQVLRSELQNVLSSYEDKVQNATVKNVHESGEAEVSRERSGLTFNYETLIASVRDSMQQLSFQPVVAGRDSFMPTILSAEVKTILPELPAKMAPGPITIVEINTDTPRTWVITVADLTGMVDVKRNTLGSLVFTLKKDAVVEFLKNRVAPEVEIPAENARFTVENNKVREFEASSKGLAVDYDGSFDGINRIFEERGSEAPSTTSEAALLTKEVVPPIQISNSNDLGIVEFFGAGTSTFKDSHTRRIQNIANAVKRLNGTLIKPGEEFSSIKSAGPFTLENGFLPEQVIKGKKLTDEVGGGMCQIGTTLFRMAMQSGLPITERHNHSLVVQYYADPVNGNPGTDATLYEPILDLKFRNDTGHYLLLLTEIDYKKQLLTFSLWGTKDGRSGWYTRPKVSKWIPAPTEVEYVKDTEGVLKVGEEKCQNAFRGAVASFTYFRVTPEGEKIEKIYDSYYRPLPKICTISPSSTPPIATSTAR